MKKINNGKKLIDFNKLNQKKSSFA